MTAQDVRDLHTETTVDGYTQGCFNGECDHVDDYCPSFPLSICDHCYDLAGETEEVDEAVKWPCKTIRALDQDHANGSE